MGPYRRLRTSAIQRGNESDPIPKAVPRKYKSNPAECVAWWCNKVFGRHADMMKHVDAQHLGTYWKCRYPGCQEKSSQRANLETHIRNVHTRELSSFCSCGHGFTDPSALSRHRKATGHTRNANAKRSSSAAVEKCRIQDALDVTTHMIADPLYVPKLFDQTYCHQSVLESHQFPLPRFSQSVSSSSSSRWDTFPITSDPISGWSNVAKPTSTFPKSSHTYETADLLEWLSLFQDNPESFQQDSIPQSNVSSTDPLQSWGNDHNIIPDQSWNLGYHCPPFPKNHGTSLDFYPFQDHMSFENSGVDHDQLLFDWPIYFDQQFTPVEPQFHCYNSSLPPPLS